MSRWADSNIDQDIHRLYVLQVHARQYRDCIQADAHTEHICLSLYAAAHGVMHQATV